jgi:hypothetical protein
LLAGDADPSACCTISDMKCRSSIPYSRDLRP